MLMGNILRVEGVHPPMSATPRLGLRHPTVVPANYDPDEYEAPSSPA
jgi:hypothetical protein